jgi:putative transcriptional regulator
MQVINNKFGALLAEKRIRERRNISLSEVAEATGLTRPTLYAWQNNTVTKYDALIIDKLCQYFGIQPGELFEYVPDGD